MLKNHLNNIGTTLGRFPLFKLLKNKYFIVTVFFMVWIIFFDTNNVIGWVDNLKTVISQERQKEYYQEEIVHIEERLKELSSNRDSLERFAREQYLFHESDEEIFILQK